MRTTVEIPDLLFKKAKRMALEKDTTLRELITAGLAVIVNEADSTQASKPKVSRLPAVAPAGGKTYALSPAQIHSILAEEEAAHYRSKR